MALRSMRARPGRTVLTLVGIALGVAVVLATDVTNRNSLAHGPRRDAGHRPRQRGAGGRVAGYGLSRVSLRVINVVSGYTLRYAFSARPYLAALAIALGVSQLAALGPARRAAQSNIVEAIKHE